MTFEKSRVVLPVDSTGGDADRTQSSGLEFLPGVIRWSRRRERPEVVVHRQ